MEYLSRAMEPKKGKVCMEELLFACIDLSYKYKHNQYVDNTLKELLKKFDIPDNNLSAGDIMRQVPVNSRIWDINLAEHTKQKTYK